STHNKPPHVYAYLLSEYTKRKRIFFVKKKAIGSACAYCLYYDLPMPRADRRTLSRPAGPSPTSFEHQPLCLRQGERGDERDNRAKRLAAEPICGPAEGVLQNHEQRGGDRQRPEHHAVIESVALDCKRNQCREERVVAERAEQGEADQLGDRLRIIAQR